MRFSLEWLRELCPVAEPAERVAAALTARGLTVDALEPANGDTVLDVDVPANRPDCLGHLGLARELSAAFGVPLVPPRAEPAPEGEDVAASVRVEIEDPALCSRYAARLVRSVRIGPSPPGVARRLEHCGLRSVNNAVDASNLVLLGLGHPIHFFDAERLASAPGTAERLIRVRGARAGERLRTLDGVDRRLEEGMLVIADARGPVAVAGVIGGADSEIGESTRQILIEAARFDPRAVRATSRRLGVQTEASHRFERGVDAAGVLAAQGLAVRLLAELAGGRPAPGTVDVYPVPRPTARLEIRPSRLGRLLGFEPEPREVQLALSAVGLAPQPLADGRVGVSVPSWRADLEREADLVEEVARHIGYDRIPAAGPANEPRGARRTELERSVEERSSDILAQLGFHEAVGYAMIGQGEDDGFVEPDAPPPIALRNPIAEPLSHLRRSILPGLLRAADLNLRRGVADVRLFEIGRVFLAREPGELPEEPSRLGIAWCGAAQPRHFSLENRDVDLFDVAGLVERVLAGLRPGLTTLRAPGGPPAFHPGRSVQWTTGASTRPMAWAGSLHPELEHRLAAPGFVAELDLSALGALPREVPRHVASARVPAVSRDLSLVVTSDLTYARLIEVLESVSPPTQVRFEAIDRYEGPPLPPGSAALTVRFRLEPTERTLTDAETERYRQALVDALDRRLGVQLRS